jgi:DNA-binding transcriptional ArsR family regulator
MVQHSKQALDLTLAALADGTRRQLLRDLARGERSISQMAQPLPVSFESVSKHLRVLERAGLVKRRRAGRIHYFSARKEPLRDVEALLAELKAFWSRTLDNLATEVEAQEQEASAKARGDRSSKHLARKKTRRGATWQHP